MVYSVKEIAELLNVNEETVRRWIRDGKLNAERGNGRQGSKITKESIVSFLEKNRGLITSTAISSLGISLVNSAAGAVVSGIAAGAGLITAGIVGTLAFPVSIAAGIGVAIVSILKATDKNKKQKQQELLQKKGEIETVVVQLELEISRQQSELSLMKEQIELLDKLLQKTI